MDLRQFPTVGGEEEVDGAVIEIGFGLKIGIDHFADGCGAI